MRKMKEMKKAGAGREIRKRKVLISQWLAGLVIIFFINLPLVTALEFSGIRAEEVTQDSAQIKWETDLPADSFVYFGSDQENLLPRGDASQVTEHGMSLSGLNTGTEYFYYVQSALEVDNNSDELYRFTTLGPDTQPPAIEMELPPFVQGNQIDLIGWAEIGAEVKLFINDGFVGSRTVPQIELNQTLGSFEFEGISLRDNELNTIKLEAVDPAGNTDSWEGQIFADTHRPQLELETVPEVVDKNSVLLKGTISENVSLEIFVGERSVKKLAGTSLNEEIRLDEGRNEIKIVLTDQAGYETVEIIEIVSDTRPPQVRFDLEKGNEYYEGRAETDINGETEAGAAVYLYVFSPNVGGGFDFDRALAQTTADEDGKFTFEDVSFPPPLTARIEAMGPREVPPGLQDILISRLENLAQEQRKTYRIVIIAEDRTGKSGYRDTVVNINTCFSGNFAFDISIHPDFPPMPFRLDPGLMEEGREQIMAVFEVKYRGSALGKVNPATGEVEPAHQISGLPRFEKACTREMAETDDYTLGCRLLPSSLNAQANPEGDAYFVSASLHPAAEFIDKEENPWEDFVDKRQLKFPLKITVRYQEREADGSWGSVKTQPFCYDLGYFVDVPIESEDLAPDFLVDQALPAINSTITKIQQIKPYVRTAAIVAGIGCVSSFLGKLIVKFYRFFISHFEPWMTRSEEEGKRCPSNAAEQRKLMMEETIEHWTKLKETYRDEGTSQRNFPEMDQEKSLDKLCPQTAGAWKAEATVDYLYKFTCDRFFCRAVPAGWTQYAEETDVEKVVARQKSCAVTADCTPLIKMENCPEDPSRKHLKDECYQHPTTRQAYRKVADPDNEVLGFWRLERATEAAGEVGIYSDPELFAYKPEGSDQFCIAQSIKCDTKCKRTPGYRAADDGWGINNGKGCYKEALNEAGELGLLNKNDKPLAENSADKLRAGYTSDCFVDKSQPNEEVRYQCVCEKTPEKTPAVKAREALKTDSQGTREKYFYHQDKIFEESKGTFGTHYPKWRYYQERDVTAAFGLDWAFDNFKNDRDFAGMSETKVDPHNQFTSSFQTLCFRGILARLTMIEQILVGLRDCIIQAKYTGLHDAGMCKTLFTQYFCNLAYKLVSYLASDCSPLSIKDSKGQYDPTDGGIKAFFDSGFKAIPEAMESSINEVKSDYGDAQVNQFFAAGAEGFAESICLFALGYDFPMGMDFIQDTVYSFSTEITPLFPIAEREMATIDPVRGNVIFNYHLAGSMWAGCKIRGYKVSLKCVGPEDVAHPDVDRSCLGQGCDCLSATTFRPEFAGEREKLIEGGASFQGVERGTAYDFPIPSPQKVSSSYRYDHVVLDLFLDSFEDPSQCFDAGRQVEGGGRFYFPIREVQAPFQVACHVDPTSGQFICPQIRTVFGGAQTYLEHPFVQCYDQRKDEDVNCDLPNVFVANENDQMVIKPYIHLGEDKACLRIRDNRGLIDKMIDLTGFQPGPYSPRLVISESIPPNLITGGSLGTIITMPESDPGCGGNNGQLEVKYPGTYIAGNSRLIKFIFTPVGGKYQVQFIGSGVQVKTAESAEYQISGGELQKGTVKELTPAEIDSVIFTTPEGFEFSQVMGSPVAKAPPSSQCIYQIVPPRVGGQAGNFGMVNLRLELFRPGPTESCLTARTPMPRSSFGVPSHAVQIRVQSQLAEEVEVSSLHSQFMGEKYDKVIETALALTNKQQSTLNDAVALYYWIASLVMKGKGVASYQADIKNLLELFFERKFGNEQVLAPYPDEVASTAEYQKINKYLCEIAEKIGYNPPQGCEPLSATAGGP